MREHRMSKGETEHYTSFEELAEGWHLKPVSKQTKDKAKLSRQREDFCGRHTCKACGKPLTYMDGVVGLMCCTNEKCNGIKNERVIDETTGEKKIWYTPSYEFLKGKALEIATNIFA